MKYVFVDIGELGWSLLLSLHIRWFRKNSHHSLAVITLSDRKCLYEGLVDLMIDVPKDFYTRFDITKQDLLGLYGTSSEELKRYFENYIPEGYVWFPELAIGGNPGFKKWHRIYEPYKYSRKLTGKKEILVFPRCRMGLKQFRYRNLPKGFYIHLVRELCASFPDYTVRTMGVHYGAYNIKEVKQPNYINAVSEESPLQNLIDLCQLAVAAIGVQSAPPKITLMQGVPTFMIGHEGTRHAQIDNWMGTEAEFYPVSKNQYHKIPQDHCINKVVEWVRKQE